MIKIFYNNKVLTISEVSLDDNSVTKIDFSDKEAVINAINNFINLDNLFLLNIFGTDEQIILKELSLNFKVINAAGGLVRDSTNKILFIKRLGFWDLPKGKLEKGESIDVAAIREVCEECGINDVDLKIIMPLTNAFHIYKLNEKVILKNTHWFLMSFVGKYPLTPQTEEDITEIIWVEKEDLSDVLVESYPSIRQVFDGFYQVAQ
jgi:8-oxo-dGTP pyrophosphatase MutT (NUDIX family)